MKKINLHGHTTYCDGANSIEEMILAAIEKGFDVFGFSGHSYLDFDHSWCMSKENTLKYIEEVKKSNEEPKDVYYVHHGAKIRYIDPLVNGERISSICKIAKNMIDKNLSYDMTKYVYLDFKL